MNKTGAQSHHKGNVTKPRANTLHKKGANNPPSKAGIPKINTKHMESKPANQAPPLIPANIDNSGETIKRSNNLEVKPEKPEPESKNIMDAPTSKVE